MGKARIFLENRNRAHVRFFKMFGKYYGKRYFPFVILTAAPPAVIDARLHELENTFSPFFARLFLFALEAKCCGGSLSRTLLF